MPNKVTVHVEYCGRWGYAPRFRDLKQRILRECPEASVDGEVGRATSFEVTINDKLVYSKLNEGAFPDFDAVIYPYIFYYIYLNHPINRSLKRWLHKLWEHSKERRSIMSLRSKILRASYYKMHLDRNTDTVF